jgi:Flp pilus assembly pilin Flp
MNIIKTLLKDTRGAAMVEFTVVMMVLFLLTGGIIDFGHLLFQWNSAEKATQAGARAAAISDPVATELATFDCKNSSILLGTSCYPDGDSFGTIVCDGSGSCSGPYSFSASAFNLIFAPMQQMFPRLQPQNVVVEYIDIGLGFAGRQSPVPEIRVRLTGMTFSYAFLGGLLGNWSIAMPDFRATLVGEDLSSAGA